MEKQGKLSFSIPTQRRRLIKPPACLAAVADEGTGSRSTPAPQFITEFGPSETATLAAAPAIIVAPLPNFHLFRREPCDGSSSLKPAIIEEAGIVFTREPDDNPRSSSHAYGLNLPSAPAAAMDKNKAPPHQITTTGSELLRRRFKQDIAALSDHRDTEEYPQVFCKGVCFCGPGWLRLVQGSRYWKEQEEKGRYKSFLVRPSPWDRGTKTDVWLRLQPRDLWGWEEEEETRH
ncbi:unnamed protein product [Miscanthus lutarioriparius]|uniref:Uncharacterized protein n=1 Tax=Miscanthus lutarioriparius TaxID=422564 RepID=A0A811PUL3_9POAL|nr:unnamed protein product [Miscanthus lutarioriparius]